MLLGFSAYNRSIPAPAFWARGRHTARCFLLRPARFFREALIFTTEGDLATTAGAMRIAGGNLQ